MRKASNTPVVALSLAVIAASSTSLAQNCGCGPDRDGACVARVEQAADGFSLMTVDLQGAKTILSWAEDQEDVARKQLIGGQLKAYYKFNVRKRFACCGDPKPEDTADWDSTLELSTGIAIKCTKSGGSAVCK